MNNDENIIDGDFVKKDKEPQLSYTFLILFVTAGIIGVMFKIMHWSLGDQLLLLGWGGLSGYLTAMTLFLKNKITKIRAFSTVIVITCLTVSKVPYLPFLALYLGITAVFFLLTFAIVSRSKKRKQAI